MTPKLTLKFDAMTQTGILETTDRHGYSHVEMFSVPPDAPVFNVQGMDCALVRELIYGKKANAA
jgi:hypothetical protein